MQLKEFITEALVQITEGVGDAKKQTQDSDVIIAPEDLRTSDTSVLYVAYGNSIRRPAQLIEFDVLVTSGTSEAGKKGINVLLNIVEFGGQKKSEDHYTEANRIRFSIPIVYGKRL